MTATRRLTVAQALVRFLTAQLSERDGVAQRLVAGCSGIFGHGNVAGIGQALLAAGDALPYRQARNEQAMVHTAVGYAWMRNRLSTLACTTSVGPGATNLVTGAALATINRIPVLLLPGDVFATRVASPLLQELADPRFGDVSVNDCLRPVSRYWDRVTRPEQLAPALLAAMRVLTDPAETGAVTLALPHDVQVEAYDFPEELFARRVWTVRRPEPEPGALAAAARLIRTARTPLLVAGGGVAYAAATAALRDFAEATGIPVAVTQAGKGALPSDHPNCVGALGVTGSPAANELARGADVVIGVGTRWTDFSTASHSLFAHPGVTFVNLNVAAPDAARLAGLPLVADARAGLQRLAAELAGYATAPAYRQRARELAVRWDGTVERAYRLGHRPLPAQSEVVGAVNEVCQPGDVVVCAAGSLPGDLHKLWRVHDPKGYHVEYGYSCMGYEIAGGLGVKMAAPEREVVVLVGDGSYLMMGQELATAVQEGLKIVVVLVQNHGFASIGSLSETLGEEGFGTRHRMRNPATGALDGDRLPVDLAANAASLGADVLRAASVEELRAALAKARESARTTVVHVETDPDVPAPPSGAWWDVPVPEVADSPAVTAARAAYDEQRTARRSYLRPAGTTDHEEL